MDQIMSVGRTAVQIADDVRAGRISAEAVVRQHLERIAAMNDEVGAFQVVRAQAALAEARAVDERVRGGATTAQALPLAGVPIAVKDNVPVQGHPMREGSSASPTQDQTTDHVVVERLRAAGGVVVGITRVPELCLWGFTDGPLGTARNPWDLSRTPGGSSGGSAAAVSAAFVPLAHGNDGLGSIRVPAACCGLVGIKPGAGVVPAAIGRDDWTGMTANGPLATTVADAALGLSVMADRPELGVLEQPATGLRIALALRSPAPGVQLDAGWAASSRSVADDLRALGYEVTEAEPPLPLWVVKAVLSRWFAGAQDDAVALGIDLTSAQPRTRTHARLGRAARRLGWVRADDTDRWRAVLQPFFDRFDVLLTPALAAPPVAAAPWATRSWFANYQASAAFTGGLQAPWNLAGWPSMTVPAGIHATGTPVAVQLTAPQGHEPRLLALASQLERRRPWQRHPR